MTNLPTRATTLVPSLPVPAIDEEARRLTGWCLSGAERRLGQRMQLLNVPTAQQRTVLQRRHQQLSAHLAQRNDETIVQALIGLLGCYRNALKPGEDVRPVALKYLKELHDLPTWACVRACDAIRDHQYADCITFVPSTIRLREIASSYCETVIREAGEIIEALCGERMMAPVSEAERERIKLGFQKLSAQMGGQFVPKEPGPRALTEDEIRAKYATGWPTSEPVAEAAE